MNRSDRLQKVVAPPEEVIQMISFSIGSELFGVRILVVQEIIMMSTITEIPNTPDFIEGVINLRGNIIPVLDLRKRLRLRSTGPTPGGQRLVSRILVVEIDQAVTGFIVDSVSKVLTIPASRLFPAPEIIVAGVQSQYISGVVHLDEGIMVVLDFRKILTIEEKSALEKVPEELPEAAEAR